MPAPLTQPTLKYLIGALLAIPALPLLYYQGKRIRATIPQLPEAEQPSGYYQVAESGERPLQLIALGESSIAGVGVKTHNEGFTGAFARQVADLLQTNTRWKVYARSGYTAQQLLTNILPQIEEASADIIVIGLGGNDAFTLNSPWRWKRSLHRLIAALHGRYPQAHIVFANMPPIKEFPAFTKLIKWTIGNLVELHGKALQEVAGQYPYVYYAREVIKVAEWIDKLQRPLSHTDFFSDGVHPSKLTYQTWGKNLAQDFARVKGALPA